MAYPGTDTFRPGALAAPVIAHAWALAVLDAVANLRANYTLAAADVARGLADRSPDDVEMALKAVEGATQQLAQVTAQALETLDALDRFSEVERPGG
ncbi:MAG: hypothetical protein H6739_17925 [Alphaproteobacteria bacterium]|nr:hypothetical protein [Alphaproteobacteria bacterium]